MASELGRFTGIVERVSPRRWRWVLLHEGVALACQFGVSDSDQAAEAMLHGFLLCMFGDEYLDTSEAVTDQALNDFLQELDDMGEMDGE